MNRNATPATLGFAAALALLIFSAALSYHNTRNLAGAQAEVDHTHRVLHELQAVLSTLQDAETGQRGFLITGEPDYLNPYNEALGRVYEEIAELRRLTARDPEQQRRLDALDARAAAKLAELGHTIDIRRREDFDSARTIVATGRGLAEMEAVRQVVAEMQQAERAQLGPRTAASAHRFRVAVVSNILTGVLGVLMLGLVYALVQLNLAERFRAQEALRQSEERFRGFMDSGPIRAWIKDSAGRYVYVNRLMEDSAGLPASGWAGKSDLDLFGAEAARRYRATDREVLEGGLTREFLDRLDGPAGTQHLLCVKFPLKDAAGVVFVGGLALDVTEQWKVESALHDNERRLRLALKAGKLGSWQLDLPAGKLSCSGQCKANLGLGADADLSYEQLLQAVHPDDRARMQEAVRQAVEGEGDYEAEYRVVWPDGSTRWILARGQILREGGKPSRMIGVTLDLTERKTLEERLHEADRRKDEFLAMLAHELRNPLAPIRNVLQTVKLADRDGSGKEPLPGSLVGVLERQVGQLVRLVDDLLDISRIRQGKVELRREPVELPGVITGAVEASRPLVESKGQVLSVSLPGETVYLDADPARLSQVVSNLLNNASKYTEAGGHIWLNCTREGEQAVLRVRDTGVGIRRDMLPVIFEPFVQLDPRTERGQGGLGIGLTLVQRLVQLHGGSVEAHSDGPGKGSEFVVRLPALAGKPPAEGSDQEQARHPAPVRILVADDNRDAADSLALLLRVLGHEVRTAHDGASALEIAHDFRPRLVLCDIGMPGMSGLEVCRRLREQFPRQEVAVLALTGYSSDRDRQRIAEAGFDQHLVKPVGLEALQDVLAGLGGEAVPSSGG